MGDLRVEYVPLTELRRWPRNPKRHDLGSLHSSVSRFGFVNPILINEASGLILAGHGRLDTLQQRKAAGESPPGNVRKNGNDWLIPVVRGVELTDEEAEAYSVADNRLVELGGWDDQVLSEVLADLAAGPGLDGVGFDEEDLDALLAELAPPKADPGAQTDRAEELREKWGTAKGQVWEVGKHHLMCGDSTSAEDVGWLLRGAEPLLMVTDPPYGVEYDANWRNEAAAEGKLAYAASRVRKVEGDNRVDWSDAYGLFPGDVAYTWSPGGDHVILTGQAIQMVGFEIRNQIIWAKPHFPISRGHYTYRHEPCWYAVRKGAQAHWVGLTNESTLWDIALDKNVDGGHSTQKPLECMERPIRNHEGDVYDPFVGSGTTIVAAERQGRQCYAMDIDPAYLAVSLERMAGMGLEPRLADG